ncbi:hypothetical protein GCM10028816_24510 [Spirosoma lituiforme]
MIRLAFFIRPISFSRIGCAGLLQVVIGRFRIITRPPITGFFPLLTRKAVLAILVGAWPSLIIVAKPIPFIGFTAKATNPFEGRFVGSAGSAIARETG